MNFQIYSHRNAQTLFENDVKYVDLWREVCDVIWNITDNDIINAYNGITRGSKKSISQPINRLLKERFINYGWYAESPIFDDLNYNDKNWRLDFAKDEISIEVAFNHGEAISWNLLKPVMASELNHIQKAIQTSAGIVICATDAMKDAGNFDSAVGSYEKFLRYLTPMYNVLTAPLMIIGLEPPDSFYIDPTTKQVAYV